jgi:hypothetical protein
MPADQVNGERIAVAVAAASNPGGASTPADCGSGRGGVQPREEHRRQRIAVAAAAASNPARSIAEGAATQRGRTLPQSDRESNPP